MVFPFGNTGHESLCEKSFFRFLTTEEVLAQIEENETVTSAIVFIQPPSDGFDSEGDSGDEDIGGSVNNLSGKQLQTNAVASVVSISRSPKGNEEDNQIGCLFDSSADSPQLPLETESSTTSGTALRRNRKRRWVRNQDLQPSFPPFTLSRKTYKKGMQPEEYFELFYDEEVINFITNMFNLYASQDKDDASFSTNPEKIKCWLGILMLSGYMSFPRWCIMREYHSELYLPSVSNAMRRNRFEILKAYAHFSDNTKLTKDNKFTKIRPLLTMLNERFLQYAILDERLCVDESMIPYFERHSAKQFLRGKPIRFGNKMWCLCDRLGYLIQCDPYQGACRTYDKELGVGASVVLDLVYELPPDVPFKIYGDRFFSSVKLAEILNSKGIGYACTVKLNRTEKAPLIDS